MNLMKFTYLVALILVILGLSAMAIGAQIIIDETPKPVVTPMVTVTASTSNTLVIGVLFVCIALCTLAGGQTYALYNSAPTWMQEIVKPLADIAMRQLDDYVTKTPTKIDDAMRDELKVIVGMFFAEKTGEVVPGEIGLGAVNVEKLE